MIESLLRPVSTGRAHVRPTKSERTAWGEQTCTASGQQSL